MPILTFVKIVSFEEFPNEITKDVRSREHLLSTFRMRVLLFALYSVRIRSFVKKTKQVCHKMSQGDTHLFSARQNRKGAVSDEGPSGKFSACLSLYFLSYQSASYRLMSTESDSTLQTTFYFRTVEAISTEVYTII